MIHVMADTAGRALIVDDDPDMRRLVRLVLEVEARMTCDEAADAFHALEAWHEHHHDVVVLDQRMPAVTGVELAEVLLQEEPEQLVILFSAYLDNQTVDHAHDIGICAVLSKEEVRRIPRLIDEARAS
jgi:CheY-like chemotaxis protein